MEAWTGHHAHAGRLVLTLMTLLPWEAVACVIQTHCALSTWTNMNPVQDLFALQATQLLRRMTLLPSLAWAVWLPMQSWMHCKLPLRLKLWQPRTCWANMRPSWLASATSGAHTGNSLNAVCCIVAADGVHALHLTLAGCHNLLSQYPHRPAAVTNSACNSLDQLLSLT